MNRGIVVEIKKRSVVVMTPEGRFLEVRPRESGACLIGEEIWFATPLKKRFPSVSIFSTVAAAIAFVIVGITIFSYVGSREVVAYISIDFNPSVELGIDRMEKVRYLTGLNMEGRDLIDGVEYKGKALKDVTVEIVNRIESRFSESSSNDIIIASTLMAPRTPIDERVLSAEVQQMITDQLMLEYPQYKDRLMVTSFVAPKEVREAAAEEGLSAGKYAVYLNARVNGYFLNIDDMKENSIYAIAQQAGGLDQLINPGDWSKESMRTWLEDEISGTLELKLEQLNFKKQDSELSDEPESPDVQALHNYAPNALSGKSLTGDNRTPLADRGEEVANAQKNNHSVASNNQQNEDADEQRRLAEQREQERQQAEEAERQQKLLAEQRERERQQAEQAQREQEQLAEQRERERQLAEAARREQEQLAEQQQKDREHEQREREKQERERERLEREREKQQEKESERLEREREKQEREREREERQKERERQEREREESEKERERQEQEREKQENEQEQQEWLYEQLRQEQERLLEKYKDEEQRLREQLQEQKGELENLINENKKEIENQVNEELGRWLDQFNTRHAE